ncbi:MAG: AAA family ATPase [Candidatus Omnitrophota bacterium]|nr:AAA family ATPase [Candidatus Omnitrophota bacterium]
MGAWIIFELLVYFILGIAVFAVYKLHKPMKMWMKSRWVMLAIIAGGYILVRLSIWGLMSLESFYQKITLATMPIQLIMVALNATIFVLMYSVFLQGGMAKISKAKIHGDLVDVKWSDVIGMENVKEEAKEVVELIRDRARVKKIGGKILRGIMMFGPPGCGKTYLAKAIATETGLPFLSMSGSEFVEIFVGVGASRVRKLFKQARELAEAHGGCIIFIDELDAIARKRVFSAFGGTEETNSTQNQLLAAMDGLGELKDKKGNPSPAQNVIVIGATNAPEDNIDKALLRPGRFDRKIYIDKPGLEDREKLFAYYLGKVQHDPSIDVGRLARKAVYKTPADIENIIKEAALIATRSGRDVVRLDDISEAIERVDMGMKHKRTMQPLEREMVAYHESGHLIVLYILHPIDDVFKASIASRRDILGVVYHQPREEVFTHNKERLLADIKVSLGGYVAEKIRFGTTSDGVAMDFKQAMIVAHNMVWRFGMSDAEYLGDYTVIPESQLSDKVKEQLNEEVDKIFKRCLKDVEALLAKEKPLLDRFVKELLEKEELDYDEIENIFNEYGKSHAVKAA